MASIIPKIKIGLAASKREKHNLSFDCSTTANIGSIQPTMCRELVPNSKMKVKVSSLCRLASMPLPTFGRISLRHYHCFVPYVDLWQPFDAMMAGQHYQGNSLASPFIPTSVPWFTFQSLMPLLSNLCDFSFAFEYDLNNPFTITSTKESWDGHVYDTVDEAQAADKLRIETVWAAVKNASAFGGSGLFSMFSYRAADSSTWRTDQYGGINAGAYVIRPRNATTTFTFAEPGVTDPDIWYSGATSITAEGADLITKIGDYAVLCRFRPELKRLRTIFIGLGYQFSPYNTENMSALKILAYYKAWFNLFSPVRERAFVDTPCYKIIKICSEKSGFLVNDVNTFNYWTSLLMELATSCYYYLPMDYYAMSVSSPMKSNQDNPFQLETGSGNTGNTVKVEASGDNANGNVHTINTSNQINPLTLRLAQRMLTWANKNTVLGRSIREYLKVHFGVSDVNPIDDGGIYRIGSSRTNIQISDIMSTAESHQGYLGEYGGKGIGYGDSEKFDFTADKFGVWLTLTVVVPESGYYQGYMKENRHLNRYQFFNPEFDALGYQVLERGEVMDDYNCDGVSWNPHTDYTRTAAFGLVPRYSEYKIGRNIVNGDFSLISQYNSMAPYTLDRRIAGGAYENVPGVDHYGLRVTKPKFVPSVVYDAFRRIDPTDHLGQYNRIFNYGGNDIDHFLMHHIFDVVLHAPMKSLSESFDTITNDDDGTIDVTHS